MKYDFDKISFIVDAMPNDYYGTDGSEYLTQNHRDLMVTVVINDVSIGWNQTVDVYDLALRNLDHKPYYSHWSGPKLDGKVIPDAKWSVFQPFTCSCGCDGCAGICDGCAGICAGIWDGIYVRERGYSVEWRAKREDGYGFLPKTFFNFEKTAYKRAFDDLIAQIVGLCSDYPNTILVVDAGYCEEQLVTGIDFLEYVRENTK